MDSPTPLRWYMRVLVLLLASSLPALTVASSFLPTALSSLPRRTASVIMSSPSWLCSSNLAIIGDRATTHLAATGPVWWDPIVAKASLSATAKLLSALAVGASATRMGILDAAAISALSRLTFYIFQPSFLLVSVSRTIADQSSRTVGGLATASTATIPMPPLWIIPAVGLIQLVLSFIQALIVTRIIPFRTDVEKRQVQMCTTFNNAGPLPLIFSQALLQHKSVSLQTATAAAISFYLLAWSPLFWTFGGRILLPAPSSSSSSSVAVAASPAGSTKTQRDNGTTTTTSTGTRNDALWEQLQTYFSPPVLGSIAGILVGGVPVLRKFFLQGMASPFTSALQTLGSAYLPAVILVLAGSLMGDSQRNRPTTTTTKTASITSSSSSSTLPSSSSTLEKSTTKPVMSITSRPSALSIVAIMATRFIVNPLLAIGLVRMASPWLGTSGSAGRAILLFVLLMEGCMPPAQNSVVLLQLSNEHSHEAKGLAQLLTILYTASVIPVTVLLSACLARSGILQFD